MKAMLFAVVEIGGPSALLFLTVAAFIITFVIVCAVAYVVLANRKPDAEKGSTWTFESGVRLPISKNAFDVIHDGVSAAVSKPTVTPETRARLDRFERQRGTFVRFYRTVMMIVGVAGMIASAFLFRDVTPGNMLGLPASIVLLLALGAFLSGLLPSRSIVGVEPIDRALLDKLNFRVARSDPRVMSLSELDIERAADSLRAGASIEEAARQAYPEYEELDDFAKRALHSAVKDSVRARNRT